MNDSQNSNIFSSSSDLSNNHLMDMDSVTYESLMTNTKAALGVDIQRELNKSTFFNFLTTLLEDCANCVSQSLGTVAELVLDPNLMLNNLIKYINDVVCILQLLCNFIKNVIESVSMSCYRLKTFPTTTGQIIINVFTHCKESESIYGNNLVKVENQLKDLFRSCHELQFIYLMILEKHFVFDLTKVAEQEILIEALEINLKIGNIVQSLDVKTMAEQWKGFTMICEKHSTYLMDKNIYSECTSVLCAMIRNNMKNSLEMDQNDKACIRSLKVTSFTIKILLKVTNIFKHAKVKNYDSVFELLVYIYLHSEPYLEWTGTKSLQFINLIRNNILTPADCLLKELFLDDKFMHCLCNYDVNATRNEDELLGFTVLLIGIMKVILQDPQKCTISKQKILICVFEAVSHCHVWFNTSMKFKMPVNSDDQQYTCGMYECVLAHTMALIVASDFEEISFAHNHMYKALLSTNCYRAIFASNLWVFLSRIAHNQLNELVPLCRVYQKLESSVLFSNSPQQIHLAHTIKRLFEMLSNDDKLSLYNQFSPVTNERNISLWTALRIENLPMDMTNGIQEELMDKCKQMLNVLFTGEMETVCQMYALINVMKLTATCTIITDDSMKDCVLRAWAKACPKHNDDLKENLNNSILWYIKYIEALVYLTIAAKDSMLEDSQNIIKILHVIIGIVERGCTEIKLLIINLLCIITIYPVHDANKHNIDDTTTETFKCLLQDSDAVVRSKLFSTLSKYMEHSKLDEIISSAINDNYALQEIWTHFVEHGTLKTGNQNDIKHILMTVKEFKYNHRCIQYNDNDNDTKDLSRASSKNFDFVDIDILFNEENAEPLCKKFKLDTNEIEDIISRLEKDALQLCKLKENVIDVVQKKRISHVCVKLQNIIG